uniref:Lily type lectin 1 n=1 Tax=Channa striata TaxID=64152 RepID=U6E198_CHASR|nr:Lily type lectin 1 [Channa striata]
MSKNYLSRNDELRKGDYLMSENGNYKAVFQGDGNFVVYAWSPIWATNTHGKNPYKILLQQDGNLVMYPKHGEAIWSTGTYSNQSCCRMRLTLNNDGQLVLERDGKTIWNTADSKGSKK